MFTIFFDLDGTLCDSLPGITESIREALALTDLTTEQVRSVIGPPVTVMLRKLMPEIDDFAVSELEARFRRSYDGGNWRNFVWYSGVEQTLLSLRSLGCRLFVFTNKPESAVRRIMQSTVFGNCFEDVITKDSKNPAYRSKTEMLRDLVTRHNVDVKRAIVVGDGEEDMRAAKELGIPFVFARYGYGTAEPNDRGSEHAHFQQIDKVQELIEICNRGFE